MIFCFKFCSVHSIGYNFHSTFCLQFRLDINSFFQIRFSVGSKQRATTAFDFEHVFCCSQFSCCSLHSLTLFALTFLCVSHSNLVIFCSVPNLQHLRQFIHSFALQRLPIFFFSLCGTSAQHTFGHCQPFLIFHYIYIGNGCMNTANIKRRHLYT